MKKYAVALLALFIMLSSLSAHAAPASFTLNLSGKEVQRGGEIILSGTVTSDDSDVVVKIVRPNQTIFYLDSITPSMGSYSTKVTIPNHEDFAPYGEYKVVAGNKSQSESKAFTIVDLNGGGSTDPGNGGGTDPGNGGGTDPGNGGGAGPGNGGGSDSGSDGGDSSSPSTGGSVTIPEPDTGSIPVNAGKTADGIVQPESSGDGRYVFGSGTLVQAMSQATGAVTIQLPADASLSVQALEFPAKSLQELKDKSLDFIIQSGNNTLRFPAGSLTSTADSQSRIRIELNAAWTEEAKQVLSRSLKNQADYASTGVILSVVIKLITGDSTVEIHTLDKPAVVAIQLTPAQEQAISSDLAGVYYVNGHQAEYVGGTIRQGIFTFTAAHFSYYTILEYNKMFADVAGHWAEPAVRSLTAKHIVDGVDDLHYELGRGITRAEFVTMLMRALKWNDTASPVAAANPFSDVAPNEYYSTPVAEAASLGIVSGYNGAFRPNDKITREEAVIALVQAAPYFQLTATVKLAPDFADWNEVAAWAEAAVSEAWAKGLIEGDGLRFHPKQSVTRAEVAVMIHRLLPKASL
ncbi:S-layer homology domain-containing protein [Paenibacillus sp. NPDC056579]|uniref:S-layer homology domain-containing protein n=1 Tax=Paenibacillus sp. NPDC056579 TaxID=3345871 RepID=UPI0036781F58